MAEAIFEEATKPPSTQRATGTRRGEFDQTLKMIADDESKHGRWFKVGVWDKRSSGSGAEDNLRGRYGKDATCQGWTFTVRKDEELSTSRGKDQFVLYVIYDPSKIVEGADAAWQKEHSEKKAEQAARYKANAAKRKAEKNALSGAEDASGNGGGATSGGAEPTNTQSAGEALSKADADAARKQAVKDKAAAGSKSA